MLVDIHIDRYALTGTLVVATPDLLITKLDANPSFSLYIFYDNGWESPK